MTAMRINYAGESPYEPVIGFSRAVRAGALLHISGTGPVGAEADNAADQARHVLAILGRVLERAGLRYEHVVRTRIYLTEAADWEAVGRAHGEVFHAIRPAATMVVVAALLDPLWRVEIEADVSFDAVQSKEQGM